MPHSATSTTMVDNHCVCRVYVADYGMQDAKAALAYGPQSGTVSTWARAHAALSSAIEGKQVRMSYAPAAVRGKPGSLACYM